MTAPGSSAKHRDAVREVVRGILSSFLPPMLPISERDLEGYGSVLVAFAARVEAEAVAGMIAEGERRILNLTTIAEGEWVGEHVEVNRALYRRAAETLSSFVAYMIRPRAAAPEATGSPSLTPPTAQAGPAQGDAWGDLASLRSVLTPLRELAAKATPGPWVDEAEYGWVRASGIGPLVQTWGKSEEDFVNAPANRALIVALVNALPALLHALAPEGAAPDAIEKSSDGGDAHA